MSGRNLRCQFLQRYEFGSPMVTFARNPFETGMRIRQFGLILTIILLDVGASPRCGAAAKPLPPSATSNFQMGAVAVDVTPVNYPVIVNGMFEERTADHDVDPLYARAFVLDDGTTRIAIVVVDSCMLPRELLDAAKERAANITGIAVDHMLISATHTHSAPSSMGCLGSRPDPQYPAYLIPQIARAIQLANNRLQPAQIGLAKVHAPNYTFCRRYIRRPDRILKDPFGAPTVRANMHPGFLSPDAIGPSGPVDDELSVLAMQTRDGKPLGVLANFSMHYVDSALLSSDYFGRFAEHLGKRLDGSDGSTSCIVAMSQGTSGDLASMNYSAQQATREYDRYADELAALAEQAYRQVKYQSHVSLAMRETKLVLGRRVPDAQRLAWAQEMAAKIGDRRPQGWPEIYALEQTFLAAEPRRELKLQAVRIGDVAITAIPNEVFAITGLKLKLQSPLRQTFNIELANGAEGYIPPPEQHKLGGYTTWAARTAGLDVDAEPKIVEAVLKLLEEVTDKPRRALPDTVGNYEAAVRQSKPAPFGGSPKWAATPRPTVAETNETPCTRMASRTICRAHRARTSQPLVKQAGPLTSRAGGCEPKYPMSAIPTPSNSGFGTACPTTPGRSPGTCSLAVRTTTTKPAEIT